MPTTVAKFADDENDYTKTITLFAKGKNLSEQLGRWVDGRQKAIEKTERVFATREEHFEEMSRDLAKALAAANGKEPAERRAIATAVSAFGALRKELGEPATENVVHFFGVDGVGMKKPRKAALLRAPSDEATFARWLRLLEAAATGPRKAAKKKTARKR